jgi:hypothetical protein
MKKIITLTIALGIQALFHTALYAPIYDYRIYEADNPNLLTKEHHAAGGKTFTVNNRSDHHVYVRIGYEANCEYTGFLLKPKQVGRVYKAPGCIPINVSGYFETHDRTSLGEIPYPIYNTRMEDTGTLQWNVLNDGIEFQGSWDGNKWTAFTVKRLYIRNATNYKAYLRIGYDSCTYSGVTLEPNTRAIIHQSSYCQVERVTGGVWKNGKWIDVPKEFSYQETFPGDGLWIIEQRPHSEQFQIRKD